MEAAKAAFTLNAQARQLQALPHQAAALGTKKTLANRAARFTGDLRKALKEWSEFTWWVREPYGQLDSQLERWTRLYQAAYVLGGLQLRALRKELVGPGKITESRLHDAILQLNSLPIEMVRATLTAQLIAPTYQSNWRFYE
jgi:hypothetical protein